MTITEFIVSAVAGMAIMLAGLVTGARHTKKYASDLYIQTKRLDALHVVFHEWRTQASEEIGAIYAFMQKYDVDAQDKIKKDLHAIERMMKENGIDEGNPEPTERLYPRRGSSI